MRPSAFSAPILLAPGLAAAQSAPVLTTAVERAAPQTTAPAWSSATTLNAPVPTGLEKRKGRRTCTATVFIKPATTTITLSNRPTPSVTTSVYPVLSTSFPGGKCYPKLKTTTKNQMPGATSTSGPVPTGGFGLRVRRGQR